MTSESDTPAAPREEPLAETLVDRLDVSFSVAHREARTMRWWERVREDILAHVAQLAAQLKDTEEACDDYSKSLHQAEAEIKRLAAQRDEAVEQFNDMDAAAQLIDDERMEYLRRAEAAESALATAHAAGYAAAREECAKIVDEEREEDGNPEQLRNLLAAIRALRPASPEPKAQGTPKAGA